MAGDADAITAAMLEQQILEEDYSKVLQAKEAGKAIEITVNHFHRNLEPKTVDIPDTGTVRDLKRHIARLEFAGSKVRGAAATTHQLYQVLHAVLRALCRWPAA